MDKSDVKVHENQSDTSSVITIKEYASSEYPSSEPPPAYIKSRPNSLRIARLAAFTIIVSSAILGGFILAASWIQANSVRNLDLTLNQELLEDLHPSYEHLIADQVLPEQETTAKSKPEAPLEKTRQDGQREVKSQTWAPGQQQEKPSLDLDEIATMLMQKKMSGNVNCIVEKRRNEELVDHVPRSLNLPFGLNITTPPRLQHLTGEQMVVICKDDDEGEKEAEPNQEQSMQPNTFPFPPQLVNYLHQPQGFVPIRNPVHQTMRHIPVRGEEHPRYQPAAYSPLRSRQPLFIDRPEVRSRPSPVNSLAFSELPLPDMPITHLPVSIQQEPVPVHHLVPPRMQETNPEAYAREQEARFQDQMLDERMNRHPYMQMRGRTGLMESRDHRSDWQALPPTESQSSAAAQGNMYFPKPLEGSIFSPFAAEIKASQSRSHNVPFFMSERHSGPKLSMIPLAIETRGPYPEERRIRFPDAPNAQDSQEIQENPVPIVTEITKIVPLTTADQRTRSNDQGNMADQNQEKPLPVPINAILDMIFKGIRPFINNKGHSFPIPIDIKIERIDNSLFDRDGGGSQNEQEKLQPAALLQDLKPVEKSAHTENEEVEAIMEPMEPMEFLDKQGTPELPRSDKVEAPSETTAAQEGKWQEPSFLPGVLGRGASAFPIPQQAREAEIFSVLDARIDKNLNVQVPVGASVSVQSVDKENEESPAEGRQGRGRSFPVQREVNMFPVLQASATKPAPTPTLPLRSQTFTLDDARSVRLYPVREVLAVDDEKQELRPHYVQPRSV